MPVQKRAVSRGTTVCIRHVCPAKKYRSGHVFGQRKRESVTFSAMRVRPIQRAWRDVHTISAQVTMNFEADAENYGRMTLGLPLNPRDPFL